MRRRWLIWTGGIVAGLVVVTLALALILGRSDAPFDFLEGRKPVPLPAFLMRADEQAGLETRIYQFQADYEPLYKAARAELVGKGFRQFASPADASAAFESGAPGGDPTVGEDPTRKEWVTVSIFKDRRIAAGRFDLMEEKGWIVVLQNATRREPSLFDRIRSWIGL